MGAEQGVKALDMNRRPAAAAEEVEDAAALSSPNSAASSFKMDFSIFRNGLLGKRDHTGADGGDRERGGSSNSRASDDDENGLGRKKLRLTKEQSAFLEESFKEHNTLNPVSLNSSDFVRRTLFRFPNMFINYSK